MSSSNTATKKPLPFATGIVFLVLLGIVGCGPRSSQSANTVQLKGSDTMVNLCQAWAEAFMQSHPEASVAVTGGGSGTGIASLINGSANVAATSREMETEEIELARKQNVFPKEYAVALDGLVVIVHPSNPVSKLTIDQIADIFTGEIKNWKEVGGKDEQIVVLSREVNSGTHVYLKEHVLRRGDKSRKEEFSPNALLLPSSQAIADEVSQNRKTIGYYGIGYVNQQHKVIAVGKTANGPFISPTIESVVDGSYEISRPLYFYTDGEPEGIIKAFVDYVRSEAAQEVTKGQDFVPIKAAAHAP